MRFRTTAPMKRGDVWWVEFDPSVGSEIRKTRPAVIVSNDAANRNLSRVVVIPLSSNVTRLYPGEALVTIAGKASKAMADQIMAADKVRLKNQIGALSRADMRDVEEAVKVHLGLPK
jgi:mRNA interferase MazF